MWKGNMKKILTSALLLMSGMCFFTACEDDRDSNPTIQQPTTFVLNTPSYATSDIDLKSSNELRFTCSQPDYNYTAAVTYKLQLSLTNSFTISFDEAEEEQIPDYAVVDESYNTCNIVTDASLFAKGVMQLGQWEEEAVPAKQKVQVRLVASVGEYIIASNVVDVNVVPYFVELTNALPQLWYFVGNGAVGNWDNKADGQGVSVIPLALVKDAEYDKKTGEGKFTYTGYFAADQFKLVLNPGAWGPMWGLEAEGMDGTLKYRPTSDDPDPAPWKPTAAGYYTLSFDCTGGTASTKISLSAYEGDAPKEFDNWELVGDFNEWSSDGAVKLTKSGFTPHIWYGDVEIPADGGVKFRTDGDWTDECGGSDFPYGLKTGDNIPLKAGSYRIVFNDIDRCYYFFTKD